MAVYTAIDDPELYFQTKLYTGTGSAASITLDGDEDMQPDLVWFKKRSSTESHYVYDAVRGVTKEIYTNSTATEDTDANSLTGFNSDGFSIGNANQLSESSETMVAWCWKANGTGSSNTNGTINTTATSANTTAGFSINTYVGTATSSQTVGHGLGAVPHMIISKNRSNSSTNYNDWIVYHHKNATANDKKLKLNTTDAVSTTNEWGDTDPTSTVYSVHTSGDGATNDGTDKIVSYVFTGIQGFSKFGSYTGNGNADGAFIYTGFRPAWLMIKRSSASGNSWEIFDNKRLGYNVDNNNIRADGDDAEYTTDRLDILSNGFKCRATTTNVNGSGSTYVYMAFAEAPFVNSNGVPCNAR